MIRFAEWLGHWSVDVYLLATVSLIIAMLATVTLRQPVHRLAVIKSLLIGLGLLAALCAVPNWSVLHLAAAKPESHSETARTFVPVANSAIESQSTAIGVAPQASFEPIPALAERTEAPSRLNIQPWTIVGVAELIGAFGVILWLTCGWIIARALRRGSHAAPREIEHLLSQVAKTSPTRNGWLPKILASDRIAVPVALGLRRPVIVLPSRMIAANSESALSQSQLSTVLAHELAHVHNCDLYWLALSRGLLVLFWPNPLYWLARRRMRLDQESLADAAAADITSREQYAEQLVGWARNLTNAGTMRLASAVGLWEGASQLRERVAILLNDRLAVLRNCSRRWRIGTTIVVLAVTSLLSLVTTRPAQTFAEKGPPATTATVERLGDEKDDTLGAVFQAATPAGVANNIDGHCVDESGEPLAGVEVLLACVSWDGTSRQEIAKQTTAPDGGFHFGEVVDIHREYPDGKIRKFPDSGVPTYQISARKASRESYSELLDQNQIAGYGAKMHIPMGPGATLRGRITSPNGEPVSGALVSVAFSQLDQWEGFQTVRTKADGTYEITDAPTLTPPSAKDDPKNELHTDSAGTFSVVARAQYQRIYVTQTEYADRSVPCRGIPGTQNIQLKPPAIIHGRVVDAATKQPVAKARVVAMSRVKSASDGDVGFEFATPDANGEYQIRTAPAGTYDLWALGPDRVNAGIKNLTISTEAQTTAPDLVLTTGGIVRVRLIDDKTGAPVELHNDDVAQIIAEPMPPYGPVGYLTLKDGRFAVRVIPGDVRISSTSATSDGELRWLGRTEDDIRVHIDDGQTLDIDIRVRKFDANKENKVQVLFKQAIAARNAGDDRKALATYDEIINLNPSFPLDLGAYIVTARLLAMSSDDTVRNGGRAVELAEKAAKLQEKPDPQLLDTLAAAYAETGDFEKAIETQKQAIDLAAKGNHDKAFRPALKLYESHQPRHESKPSPPKASGKDGASNPESPAPRMDAGPTGATLIGRVFGPDGKPVGGAKVSVTRGNYSDILDGIALAKCETDADGKYKIENLQPFDLNAYYERVDDLKRRPENGNILYDPPQTLIVEATGFATKKIPLEGVPGKQNVELEQPAIIEGRVVFENNEHETGNVLVQAVPILNGRNSDLYSSDRMLTMRTTVRPDTAGNYRFTTLPPGSFYVSASAPGWTTNGIPSMDSTMGSTVKKPTRLPEIVFTKGGIVAVRMIDAETNRPIELQPGMRAMLDRSSAPNPPTGQNANENSVAANAQGRFEMRVPAGKWTILAGWINSPQGEAIWLGHERIRIDILTGQTIEIDAPLKKVVAGSEN